MAKKNRMGGAAAEAARRQAASAKRAGELVSQRATEQDRVRVSALDAVRQATADLGRTALWQDESARRAREAGASWGDIGKALGISKQAAQRRYGV
jgi:hypothetical protein